MKYLILTNKKEAETLTKELYKLSRPDSVRDSKDVTTSMYGIIEHTDGRVALQILDDGEDDFHVSDKKDSKELGKIYKKLFKNKPDKIKGNVNKVDVDGNPIKKIKMKDVFPTENFVSQEDMEADGWFSEEII